MVENVYSRFQEVYRKVVEENEGRRLSPKERLLFGTGENLVFFKFMERYVDGVFDYSVDSYINSQEGFKLESEDLPNSARLFRGTNIKYFTPKMRYRLNPDHNTSWSHSPYEAADWLKMQDNPEGSGVILVCNFEDLVRRGSIKQTGAGVFSFHSNKKEPIKPIGILTPDLTQKH